MASPTTGDVTEAPDTETTTTPTAGSPASLAGDPLLAEIVRGEPVVWMLAPDGFAAGDFTTVWVGDPLVGVEASIDPGSLQWVRVEGVLRAPRARLVVTAHGVRAGQVRSAGFVHALVPGSEGPDGSLRRAELPAALLGGAVNPITVVVERQDGARAEGTLHVRWSPRVPPARGRVLLDSSCSPWAVRPADVELPPDRWVYVGCRMDTVRSAGVRTPSLEILVLWDGAGDRLDVEGIATPSTGPSVWRVRVSPSPGLLSLSHGTERLVLRYAIPNRLRKGFFGMGIGPYLDEFTVDGQVQHLSQPLLTLYAAYQVSAASRVVMFNATAIRAGGYTDTGLYLVRRTSESFDRRLTFNVFLGGHLLFYEANGEVFPDFSAPQGVEVLIRDVGGRGYNVLAGGLLNPGFADRTYYNAWLRWGTGSAFVELNYIEWTQRIELEDQPGIARDVRLRSFGLSVGFPLFRFL